ncbi:hypothetical protein AB0M91_15400 [Micromonospora rifamycinica]|uniref:hypothetical protein n=1 Tax=Micromonospora rifamycinica TaxID=291594 RepID=UPI0034144E99
MAQVDIRWGIPGVAEQAQVLPDSTPAVIGALEAAGLTVEVPPYTLDDLGRSKDPTTALVLPVLVSTSAVVTGILVDVLVDLVRKRFTEAAPRSAKARITVILPTDDGGSREHRLDGTVDDVLADLDKLR